VVKISNMLYTVQSQEWSPQNEFDANDACPLLIHSQLPVGVSCSPIKDVLPTLTGAVHSRTAEDILPETEPRLIFYIERKFNFRNLPDRTNYKQRMEGNLYIRRKQGVCACNEYKAKLRQVGEDWTVLELDCVAGANDCAEPTPGIPALCTFDSFILHTT
jgi:hypothetical protein